MGAVRGGGFENCYFQQKRHLWLAIMWSPSTHLFNGIGSRYHARELIANIEVSKSLIGVEPPGLESARSLICGYVAAGVILLFMCNFLCMVVEVMRGMGKPILSFYSSGFILSTFIATSTNTSRRNHHLWERVQDEKERICRVAKLPYLSYLLRGFS